jgi:hypothetical protein
VAAALVVLTGCSQTAALAPVGGNRLAEVRFAVNDVLVDAGIEVMTWPVCTANGDAVNCTGATLDGAMITGVSTAAAQADVEVTVGGQSIYQGPFQTVLDKHARAK